MSYTPVIPPHPDERQPPAPVEPPVIPTLSPNNIPMTPAWMGHPQAMSNPAAFPSSLYPPGSYFPPPVALPHMSTPVAPVGPGGISLDWTGFPHYGANGQIIAHHNYPQYIPMPNQAAHSAHHATPAGYPPAAGAPPPVIPQGISGQIPMSYFGSAATPWQGPIPGQFATPFVTTTMMPQAWPSHTPFHPAQPALAPFAPQAAAPQPPQPPPVHHRAYRSQEVTDRFDKFAEHPKYGPVLDAYLTRVVDARIEVNPLLAPPPDRLDERPYIKWNMLWPTAQCQRSCDPGGRSWAEGRDAPATWPRVNSLRLITRSFPWMISIEAGDPEAGVTCGDVMESIATFMYGRVSKAQMDGASPAQKALISQSYWHNRSTTPGVPGGRLARTLLRCDWLGMQTSFGGIVEPEERTVQEVSGGVTLPCTFELKCLQRYPMTEEELREQEARELEAHQRAERRAHRRSRATSRAGTRPPSRVPSRPPSRAPSRNARVEDGSISSDTDSDT